MDKKQFNQLVKKLDEIRCGIIDVKNVADKILVDINSTSTQQTKVTISLLQRWMDAWPKSEEMPEGLLGETYDLIEKQ